MRSGGTSSPSWSGTNNKGSDPTVSRRSLERCPPAGPQWRAVDLAYGRLPGKDLPPRYGPYQTCHRRFQQWVQSGALDGILWAVCEDLPARGELGLEESFIEASFIGAQKEATALFQRAAARGARSWQSGIAMVFLSPSGLQALR